MSVRGISILVGLAGVACSSEALPTDVIALAANGLQEQVSLSATTIAVGDSIMIRSVVRNVGTHAATVQSGDCGTPGLAVSGVTFVARPDTAICAIGIAIGQLAPGDSVVAAITTPPIESPPGNYILTVEQQNVPARVAVRVVAAP